MSCFSILYYLLNSLISIYIAFVDFSDISLNVSILFLKTDNFTTSFIIWLPLIYFSSLITLAKIFSRIDKSGQSSLFPDVRSKEFRNLA